MNQPHLTVYFVRHGEYENPEAVVPFRTEGFNLSSKGRNDIENVSELFKDITIDAIYSSPVLRARQSGEIFSSKLNLPLKITEDLSEVRSPFIGMKEDEFHQHEGQGRAANNRFHLENGGETIGQIYDRVKNLVLRLARNHPNGKVICVSHGDPIMYFCQIEKGIYDFKYNFPSFKSYISKAGIVKVEFDENDMIINFEEVNY